LTDKKKLKEFGGTEAFNRIKKDLIKEVADERYRFAVLDICTFR